jgi:large subunit ribosomal protein L16
MKFKRYQKSKIKFPEQLMSTTIKFNFGSVGIQALESALVTPQQLESVRRTIIRKIGFRCRIWFKIFPDQIFTSKPKEIRMGRGKGNMKNYVFKVRKHRLILETTGVNLNKIVLRLKLALGKLPFKARVIHKGL